MPTLRKGRGTGATPGQQAQDDPSFDPGSGSDEEEEEPTEPSARGGSELEETISAALKPLMDRLRALEDRRDTPEEVELVSEDWQLHPDLFEQYATRWVRPVIDRFAAPGNQMCPRYNALHLGPGVEAVDAFSQDWSTDVNWWNPPWSRITQVLRKIVDDQASGILVVPVWPSAVWWPLFRDTVTTFDILDASSTLFRPRGSQVALGPPKWKVAIGLVSPNAWRT